MPTTYNLYFQAYPEGWTVYNASLDYALDALAGNEFLGTDSCGDAVYGVESVDVVSPFNA